MEDGVVGEPAHTPHTKTTKIPRNLVKTFVFYPTFLTYLITKYGQYHSIYLIVKILLFFIGKDHFRDILEHEICHSICP